MAELYITFGGRYAHEKHPTFLAAHPDGFLTVRFAEDLPYETARMTVWTFLDRGAYAFDYAERPDLETFPRGELDVLTLPGAPERCPICHVGELLPVGVPEYDHTDAWFAAGEPTSIEQCNRCDHQEVS